MLLDQTLLQIGKKEVSRAYKEKKHYNNTKYNERHRTYDIKHGRVKEPDKKQRLKVERLEIMKYLQNIDQMEFIEYINGEEVVVSWEYYYKPREIAQIKELRDIHQLDNYNDYLKYKKLMNKSGVSHV